MQRQARAVKSNSGEAQNQIGQRRALTGSYRTASYSSVFERPVKVLCSLRPCLVVSESRWRINRNHVLTLSLLSHPVFDFVLQIFHLIPAEANIWRRIFAELCLRSRLILDLVTSVGLVSLSLCQSANRRPLAYALLSKSLAEISRLVKLSKHSLTELHILEILAGGLLVGHIEQFDNGLGKHSNECVSQALEVIHHLIEHPSQGLEPSQQQQPQRTTCVDMGPGSPFRFLTRTHLWWETMSRTLGPGPGPSRSSAIFQVVRGWESQVRLDLVTESMQYACTWPLDLLEAVARTKTLSERLQEQNCPSGHAQGGSEEILNANIFADSRRRGRSPDRLFSDSVVTQARSIETQIRSCRPQMVPSDTLLAAELRYVIFEVLQAGALIYFSKALLGETKSMCKEVEKVIAFLNRRQKPPPLHQSRHPPASLPPSTNDRNPASRAQAVGDNPSPTMWQDRAPDGALFWAYLQAATALENPEEQALCRSTLQDWLAHADCGAVDISIEFLESYWKMRESKPSLTWEEVLSERRWTQLLLF